MVDFVRKIRTLMGPKDFRGFYLILAGVLINAGLETLGVGIILPFISVVNDPSQLNDYPRIIQALGLFGATDDQGRIVTLAAAILSLMVFKNGFFYLFLRFQLRYIYQNSADYSVRLLEGYLKADYLFHLKTNSAVLLRNLKQEVPLLFARALLPLIVLLTELTIGLCVAGLLIFTAPLVTLASVVVVGAPTLLFYGLLKKKARAYGQERLEHEAQTFKWIGQSLNGIKEAKLYGASDFLVKKTEVHYNRLAKIIIFETLNGQTPRVFLEVLMVGGLMAVIILLTLQGQTSSEIMPLLALFGAAAFRLMPAANRVVGSALTLRIAGPSLENVHQNFEDLKKADLDRARTKEALEPLHFNQAIEIDDVSFVFEGAKSPALDGLSFKIEKNQSVGLMGPSGSGKSTFLNLLLGLLKPSAGAIKVDGTDIDANLNAWRRMIGFVPQDIYLTDDLIKRNVAYGLPDDQIDDAQVWRALEMAQLKEMVEALPEGLDTYVGERGTRLSGGQRQRIGIARALYHNPEVLVFDEATSALDSETEAEITKSIEALAHKKTIVIVAHRLSTIANCDLVYKLDQGRLSRTEL